MSERLLNDCVSVMDDISNRLFCLCPTGKIPDRGQDLWGLIESDFFDSICHV